MKPAAAQIDYVRAEGPVGTFQAILKRNGQAEWRKVWGEGDGGSNSCEIGAPHYAGASFEHNDDC